MSESVLQYGALGLLALVLVGLGLGAKLLLVPLVQGAVKVGEDNIETNRAMREALVGMGQRVARQGRELGTIGDMVEDLHRNAFGTKRTSEYGRQRSGDEDEEG